PPRGRAMLWRRLVASVAVCAAAAGCQAERSALAVGGAAQAVAARPEADPAAVQRSQKPEGDTSKSAGPITLLNLTPEQANDRRAVATIRATVNGVPIFDQEIRNTGASTPEEVRKALDALIDRELIIKDAEARFSKGNGSKFMEKLKETAGKEFDRQVVRNA